MKFFLVLHKGKPYTSKQLTKASIPECVAVGCRRWTCGTRRQWTRGSRQWARVSRWWTRGSRRWTRGSRARTHWCPASQWPPTPKGVNPLACIKEEENLVQARRTSTTMRKRKGLISADRGGFRYATPLPIFAFWCWKPNLLLVFTIMSVYWIECVLRTCVHFLSLQFSRPSLCSGASVCCLKTVPTTPTRMIWRLTPLHPWALNVFKSLRCCSVALCI